MNAPGTEKSATFFLAKRSWVDMAPGPSFVMIPKEPVGMVSPTLMVMVDDVVERGRERCRRRLGVMMRVAIIFCMMCCSRVLALRAIDS